MANDWAYEEQTSDFAPTRIQAYLDSDSGEVLATGEKSQAAIVISVDKKDPLKFQPRVNILLYNDYASPCYKYCSVLLNIDGKVQEPLEARSPNKSAYAVSSSRGFIKKIENAQSIKIATKSARGDMLQFEFKPNNPLNNTKLRLN